MRGNDRDTRYGPRVPACAKTCRFVRVFARKQALLRGTMVAQSALLCGSSTSSPLPTSSLSRPVPSTLNPIHPAGPSKTRRARERPALAVKTPAAAEEAAELVSRAIPAAEAPLARPWSTWMAAQAQLAWAALEAPAAAAAAAQAELAALAEAAVCEGKTSGLARRTGRFLRRHDDADNATKTTKLQRPMTPRVLVDDVRDELGEQSIDHAQTPRHLARHVQHEQRIRA